MSEASGHSCIHITKTTVKDLVKVEFALQASSQLYNMELELLVAELRKSLQEDDSIYKFDKILNNIFLLNFIQGRKGDIQSAKKYLKGYLKLRTETYPEAIPTSFPLSTRLYNEGHVRLLKSLDEEGRYVLVFTISNWNPNPDSKIAALEWMMELCLFVDYFMQTQVIQSTKGVVCIMDCRGYEYRHIKLLTPSNMIRAITLALTYPIKFKAAHFIMSGFVMRSILSLAIPLVPKKLAKRVVVHKSPETLPDHFSKTILPSTLAGDLEGDAAFDMELPEKVQDLQQYFKEFYNVSRQPL